MTSDDTLSPNVMSLDPDDVAMVSDSEKEPVAIIPDTLDGDADQLQELTLASDFDAMKEIVLPPLLEDPKILEDVVYTWSVSSWRSMSKKEHGPVFEAGGYPWRILLFPHGNNVEQCSIYLEHGFEPSTIPDNWSCCVQFALVLWNPNDPSLFYNHTAHHRFTKEESDWGFTRFLELRKMFNLPWERGSRPLCEAEAANITAYIRVVEDETGVLWHNFANYDSKKETGYVGLKNQGATCYLNSLLQSLYFTNAFRKAIYGIPTEDDASMTNSAYTIQRLFYQLQTSESAVSTNELTKSFGWETRHVFEQQDVQELSRKLMERMENKMKGTPAEAFLPQIFSGKIKTYISCINVEYESSRIEDFWDIQLNVSGNKSLLDSFQDYVQVEKMDGENQYFAGDEFKLQDANKGVIFISFPDVLHLQLKRFEYDIQRDTMTKVNARYEFPDVFDASSYLAADADRSESWEYQLHGVLVHSGDLNAGHYYAFLKPEKEGWFYRYDDDKVTRATMREVLEENFGGEYRLPNGNPRVQQTEKAPMMRQNSAYMLVYIRKSKLDKILCPVTQEDIPQHLKSRVEEESALKEARRKEREEAHLYLGVKVITNETFGHHGGTDLAVFDGSTSDAASPKVYRVLRITPMEELIATIAADLGQDPKRVRVWQMVNRQNKTVRPDIPVMDLKPTIEETYTRAATHRDPALRLWAEVAEEVNAEGEAVWPTFQSQLNGMVVKNDLILLFLKYFDAESQTLRGIGHVYLSKEKKVDDVIPIITKRMGWGEKLPSEEKLILWEEIKPSMVEVLKGRLTLKAAELQDGDIICFQRFQERKSDTTTGGEKSTPDNEESWTDRFEDAQKYYDFLCNKKTIKFLAHPTKGEPTKQDSFDLVLNSKIGYDVLAARVAREIVCLPTHLRLWTVNASTGNPKIAVKRAATPPSLHTILNPPGYSSLSGNQRNDALYFEVLEIPLAEIDTNKNVKLIWLSEGITKETPIDILVPKSGTIESLIQVLVRKAQIPDESQCGRIRVYEASGNKFFRELNRDLAVSSISEYTSVFAERMLEEETEVEDNHFILAFHFNGEPNKAHGVPFKFLLKEDELFGDTKKRLERRTGFKGKIFEKIKFAVIRRSQFSKAQYLEDDDCLWNLTGSDDDFLGLDHPDRSRSIRNGVGDLFLR